MIKIYSAEKGTFLKKVNKSEAEVNRFLSENWSHFFPQYALFPDFTEFKKHSTNIAWETEVWVVDFPGHMIHFNGDRFMGPR